MNIYDCLHMNGKPDDVGLLPIVDVYWPHIRDDSDRDNVDWNKLDVFCLKAQSKRQKLVLDIEHWNLISGSIEDTQWALSKYMEVMDYIHVKYPDVSVGLYNKPFDSWFNGYNNPTNEALYQSKLPFIQPLIAACDFQTIAIYPYWPDESYWLDKINFRMPTLEGVE